MHVRNPMPSKDSRLRRSLSEITETSYTAVTEAEPEDRHRPPSPTLDGDVSLPLIYDSEGPTAM